MRYVHELLSNSFFLAFWLTSAFVISFKGCPTVGHSALVDDKNILHLAFASKRIAYNCSIQTIEWIVCYLLPLFRRAHRNDSTQGWRASLTQQLEALCQLTVCTLINNLILIFFQEMWSQLISPKKSIQLCGISLGCGGDGTKQDGF